MADSVAVIPELSFFEQAQDLANFLSRGIPEAQRSSYLDPISSITSSSSTTSTNENGEEVTTAKELSEEEKEGLVEKVLEGVELGNGGLDGGEREIESYHLLLTSFILATKASEQRVVKVVDAITKAASAGKRTDTAARVLSNTYNLLPPTSALRPKTLFSLLTILLSISDSTITASTTSPISSQFISQSLSQWSLDTSLKISWLQSVAKLYEANATSNKVYQERALEYRILGLKLAAGEGEGDVKAAAEEAVVALVGIEGKFELEEVLSVKGVREGLSGEVKELVDVLEGSGVEEGLKWVQAHGDFLSSKGLKAELVERKLRLLALVSLCAGSANKELSYDEIASSLKIDEDDVEIWVIDAIHSNLLKASLSQPTKTLRIHSVQSRSFGPSEWKLLSQRLGEWKTVLDDVQKTVSEAIVVSEQSGKEQGRPGQKRGPGAGGPRRKVQEEKGGEQGQGQREGVAA